MEFRQMTLFEFQKKYDCQRCIWMKQYKYCYPKTKLNRRRFITDHDGISCSDYFAARTDPHGKDPEARKRK